MNTTKVINGKKYSIRIISSTEQKSFISGNDAEMDARATEAVKSAVEKAKFCKKPIAGYDIITKRAYVEYANGERKYVD